jgi:hypothetical protein
MQNKLPQFEANQVLSNVHLNQFIEYLEEQGRLTRNQLLGAGIVSGLDVKRDSATSISIYEGVAVTLRVTELFLTLSTGLRRTIKEEGLLVITGEESLNQKIFCLHSMGDFETLATATHYLMEQLVNFFFDRIFCSGHH